MGVDVQIQLFEREAYARLVDARRCWDRARDTGPLVDVLRETLAKVRAHAPARAAMRDRKHEILRQIETLSEPPPPEPNAGWLQFQRTMAGMARRVRAAQQSADPLAHFQAMQAASEAALGAFRSAAALDPVRIALAAELDELSQDPPGPSLDETDIEDAIAVLVGPDSTPEQREQAASEIAPVLVEAHAIAWDRELRADVGVGRGALPRWLIESSDWLGNVVAGGGASGEFLELAGSTQLFTGDEVLRFRDELSRLPLAPDPHLGRRVARVRRVVDLALSDAGLALAISVG
jgi:hypothetical protein